MMTDTCAGCYNELAGGYCHMNLELECAAGGHEMYRPRRENEFDDIETATVWAKMTYPGGYRIAKSGTKCIVYGEARE